MSNVALGIDQVSSKLARLRKNGKKLNVGILCHPSSATRQFVHLADIVEKTQNLVALFGPQHGIRGETQDNMIEWQSFQDEKGRPVYSLYGERRIPKRDWLKDVDLMIVDLFDVGSRYYTFIYTMAYMMEVCGELGIPVMICDRPNPLGGQLVEGPILNLNFKSFVGLYEIPICHGMTIGELAKFFASKMKNPPKLEIIKMKNWKRSMHWPETGLTWTLPSPNMPNYMAALVYPGMCWVEGASFSEGRGTTRPFELIGAPFMNWQHIESEYRALQKKLKLPEIVFHRQGFIPTFHKHANEICLGAIQFVPQPKKFLPVRHAAVLFWVLRRLYGDQWSWKKPPYEYEFEKWPIDILSGGPELRECVDSGSPLKDLFAAWAKDEAAFKKSRRPYLLYS